MTQGRRTLFFPFRFLSVFFPPFRAPPNAPNPLKIGQNMIYYRASANERTQEKMNETACATVNQIVEWLKVKGADAALNVLLAAVMLVAGWFLIRLIANGLRTALTRGGQKEPRRLMVTFIVSVVEKACWAILGVMVLARLGVNVGPLIAGLGAGGFIVGFACQESLGNLASGLMIAINEPFKVGDFIEAAGLAGKVVAVDMMATTLTTADNKKIVLPNKSVWGAPITNYAALKQRRVDLQVGVAYGSDLGATLTTIRAALAKVAGVLTDPAPVVAVASLADSAVVINVRPWCRTADYWNVYSDTLKTIKEDLAAAGIEIPFPQVVVHQAQG